MNKMISDFQNRRRPRRAFTMVELLVVIAGLGIVGGMLFGIWSETRGATEKVMGRQAAIDYSVLTLDEAAGLLRGAIHPGELENFDSSHVLFESTRAIFPAYSSETGAPVLVGIEPTLEDEAYAWTVYESPIAEDGSIGEAVEVGGLGLVTEQKGFYSKHFAPLIEFSYATESVPGQPVEYVDALAPDEWPALVGITVTVAEPENFEHPIVLETAVVPGRFAGEAVTTVTTVATEQPVQPEAAGPATQAPGAAQQPAPAEPAAEAATAEQPAQPGAASPETEPQPASPQPGGQS